jgi:hypothetical protein
MFARQLRREFGHAPGALLKLLLEAWQNRGTNRPRLIKHVPKRVDRVATAMAEATQLRLR